MEKENNPCLDLKDIKPNSVGLKVKLDCAAPVKSGNSQFGTWNLWFGFVENTRVREGKKPNQKTVDGYSGKVLFFPNQYVNDQLIKLAGGQVGVEVLIKSELKETKPGIWTPNFTIEKLSGGQSNATSNLSPYEENLVSDGRALLAMGRILNEGIFITSSQEDVYGGQISVARAKELYKLVTD